MNAYRPNKLIFIVEDDEMYSVVLDHLLSSKNGFHYVHFKNGEECLQNLHLKPEMIILDYQLPGMNGLDLFKKIKVFRPGLPVVVLTEYYDVQIAKEFLEEGAFDYLNKQEEVVLKLQDLIKGVLGETKIPQKKISGIQISKSFLNTLVPIICFSDAFASFN